MLCLELEDPGFDYSVLCEFRARLLEGDAEHRLFDKILSRLRERKLVKARSRPRTDSTHVLAAVRDLNRLERVMETLHAALNALAMVEPNCLRTHIPAAWVDRYGQRTDANRLPSEEKAREEFAEVVGCDGHALLAALGSKEAPEWLRQIPAVEILRQVWVQNFMVEEEAVRWRQKDNMPPAGRRISSPYDPEARYAHKRSTTWVGYKVHLTETCEDDMPHLITNVHTEEAVINDNDALSKVHQQLSDRALLPDQHWVDGGYMEAQQLIESQQKYGVALIGPVQNNGRWQREQGTGFDLSHFIIDWERQEVTCPAGKKSSTLRPMVDPRGNDVLNAIFRKADCSPCANLSQCTKAKGKRRTITLKPQALHEALQKARRREETEEFKELYRKRAGVEGTISQGVRAFGMRRCRYMGIAKTRLQHLATAAAMNMERVADWWAGAPREQTRRSALARVMQPLAA